MLSPELKSKLHPEPDRIRFMCDKMESYIQDNDIDIFMDEPEIQKHPCRTICCHAGLFALSLEKVDKLYLSFGNLVGGKLVHYNGFTKAVDNMADYLRPGFEWTQLNLREWAEKNPQFWGNKRGNFMFIDGSAFDTPGYRLSPQVIIDHWRLVAQRIENYYAACIAST